MTVIQDCGLDKISKTKKQKQPPNQTFIPPISPILFHYKDWQDYKVREHNPIQGRSSWDTATEFNPSIIYFCI